MGTKRFRNSIKLRRYQEFFLSFLVNKSIYKPDVYSETLHYPWILCYLIPAQINLQKKTPVNDKMF